MPPTYSPWSVQNNSTMVSLFFFFTCTPACYTWYDTTHLHVALDPTPTPVYVGSAVVTRTLSSTTSQCSNPKPHPGSMGVGLSSRPSPLFSSGLLATPQLEFEAGHSSRENSDLRAFLINSRRSAINNTRGYAGETTSSCL